MNVEVFWLEWAWSLGAVAAAALAAWFLATLVLRMLKRLIARRAGAIEDLLLHHARRPLRWLATLIAAQIAVAPAGLSPDIAQPMLHMTALVMIGTVAWLVIAVTRAVVDLISRRYDVAVSDNLVARQIHTQVRVLVRVTTVVIIIITAAAMLMTFPSVRQLGASLLASAGLAGLVVGFAARPVLQNLIAGVQIALTQPIRLDDVVIIDGEWGQIEEIRSTYVVVKIWDLRRLVVPLSFFVEHAFQNWTRTTANLLGSVFINVDYTVPVDKVREKLHEILRASGMWDGQAWALQVTDGTERTVQLRALMSAPDGPRAWELRCHVREKLIEYLQQTYPGALPRVRTESDSPGMTADV